MVNDHLFFYREMRFVMIKLVAADLDDTLLDENSKLSDENKKVIAQARTQGLAFTIATGRMFRAAAPFAKELGLAPEQPIICYNGALIRRLSGETLYEQPLSPELSSMIVDYGQSRGWTINAYFEDELYVAALNKQVEDYAALIRVGVTVVGDLVEFIQDGNKRLSKLMIISQPEETLTRIEELRPLVGTSLQLVRSRARFIEVTNPNAHKGEALLWLARSLGFQASEVLAIGDSNNDLTMLQMAGIGVAMANAPQGVKDAADHVTSANSEHGVARAITEFAFKK